jgi:phosphonate utilization transcriptional regulator
MKTLSRPAAAAPEPVARSVPPAAPGRLARRADERLPATASKADLNDSLPASAAGASPAALATAGVPSAGASSIALLQSHSLSSLVQAEIERLILAGELPPGAKLTEALLAERLGVSRGPVREALRLLERSGLVRQEKNRGAYVRDLAPDEAAEIYALRAVLDEAVGRQLACTVSSAQLAALRDMVHAMEAFVAAGDAPGYTLLNLQFHDRLVEFAGNRRQTEIYRQLVNELSLFRRLNLADGQQMPASASEHRAILDAIAAGDADAAGTALREHALESRDRSLRLHRALLAASPTSADPAAELAASAATESPR